VEDRLDLVHDLLDRLVVDRDGRELGRVDSILVEIEAAGPRVTALVIGASALFHRVAPLGGRCAAALERILDIDRGRPVRIPMTAVLDVTDRVRVDLAAGDTVAPVLERRLRDIFRAIPGGL
jgi:sporulation protein YlmC with PRC-barrel domain